MISATRVAEGKWWQRPWSLVDGCTRVSEACDNCWALGVAHRFGRDGPVQFREDRLDIPADTRKPMLWAIWNDPCHPVVTDEDLEWALAVMKATPRHRYVWLTKRPERLRTLGAGAFSPNIIVGTTVENQYWADERIPLLLQCPVSVRMLSVEPLLGPIALPILGARARCTRCGSYTVGTQTHGCAHGTGGTCYCGAYLSYETVTSPIHWVVVGAETGSKRRPCKLEWIESIVEQCCNADVPCFVKTVEVDGKLVKDMTDPHWPMWAKREFPAGIEVTA